MDAKTCLQKLQFVGVLAFATVDEQGAPQIRNISAIHFEPNALYFFTAKGKDFCRQLLADGRVQILGYTKYKEMIRLSAQAKPVCEAEQQQWIDTIFAEQPYLCNVYPGDTRKLAGIVFKIADAEIEYFHLGVNPIFRESYAIGNGVIHEKGYQITDACIGCGSCAGHCPQRCIAPGTPYQIQQRHCLHCGNCYRVCPAHAVEKRGNDDPDRTQIVFDPAAACGTAYGAKSACSHGPHRTKKAASRTDESPLSAGHQRKLP